MYFEECSKEREEGEREKTEKEVKKDTHGMLKAKIMDGERGMRENKEIQKKIKG